MKKSYTPFPKFMEFVKEKEQELGDPFTIITTVFMPNGSEGYIEIKMKNGPSYQFRMDKDDFFRAVKTLEKYNHVFR